MLHFLIILNERKLVLCTPVCISAPNAGIDSGFVASSPQQFLREILNAAVPLQKNLRRFGSDWVSGKIESVLKKISLRATCLRHSLMSLRIPELYKNTELPLYSQPRN